MSQIVSTLKDIDIHSFVDEEERREAVNQTYTLLSRIEPPWITAYRLALTVPIQLALLKTVNNIGLFRRWLELNQGSKTSIDRLNHLVQCDPELLRRIVNHLVATNTLWMNTDGLYEMTPFAKSLVEDDMDAVVDHSLLMGTPMMLNISAFLKDIDHQNPDGKDRDFFRHWKNQSVWEYIAANSAIATNIGQYMKATSSKRGHFFELYPTEHLNCNGDDALIVDIGGSLGHDLQAFKTTRPSATGRLILQDLPHVIESAKTNPHMHASIEMQAYDFFAPQPVIGARIYLLHATLHDWPDADAVRILEIIRPAMRPGYSKLLVHEVVVPEVGPDMESTTRDWIMLAFASGIERTEQQWNKLLTSTGFRIVKIWRSPLYTESVIEVEAA